MVPISTLRRYLNAEGRARFALVFWFLLFLRQPVDPTDTSAPHEARIKEGAAVAPAVLGYWLAPVLSWICISLFNMPSRTSGYPAIKANAWLVVLTTTELRALAILDLQKFNFDVERAKGIIHSRIINLTVLKRSWRHVDAFTLKIYRYLQALIDLASAAL